MPFNGFDSEISMASYASQSPHLSLIWRAATALATALPLFANAAGADSSDTALPKVRAFLAVADDQGQTLRAENSTYGSNPSPARLVFTMQADMSPRTSVLFERSRAAPLAEPTAPRVMAAAATRVGVEFRPVSAGNALKPIGALRVQLSDSSTLSFKPRRGGVLVSWRSQF